MDEDMIKRPSPRLLGSVAALVTLALDQANKLWLIFVYGIEARQPVRITPFFDVIFAKNTGISYSLFRAETDMQRFSLLAFIAFATLFLGIWLWRSKTTLVGLALGLVVGGALGNAIDRFAYGFVADFYHFHLGGFSWYVFNLADVAIVGGVGLLLYDSLLASRDAQGVEQAAGK
jgi:signal peptidase II